MPFPFPDRTALMLQEANVTFGYLDRASRRLEMMLRQEGEDDVIILMHFGLLYYISLLACMRAGRPAVPIDPSLPVEIRNEQIRRLGSGLLLTDESISMDEIPFQRLLVAPDAADLNMHCDEQYPNAWQSSAIKGHLPLHRSFTSGSSGQQTLVTISRQAMFHDVSTTPDLYGLTDNYTLSNIGRFTSSFHINGFWRCLSTGASFMPIDLKTETSSSVMSRWGKISNVMLQGHPSLMDVIFDLNAPPVPLVSIRHLILGGEPLKVSWLTKLKQRLPCVERVSYNYSSTETMLIACRTFQMDQIDEMTRIPAGFPAPGKMVHILDESGVALPIGEVGEIFVTSAFIGSSMEGSGAASRLKHDPDSGLRTWQTRDLGRWLPDGSIEHLGRADRQMKINGQRIDPVFIEQCIETIDNIMRSIVFTIRDINDGQRLAAVYACTKDVQPSHIRAVLSDILPAGFIPAGIFRVDEIPLTHRGKPDFEALERIVHEQWGMNKVAEEEGLVSDESGIGLFLHQKWVTMLPGGRCDACCSIFDQGADSVMLLKMVSAISDRFGVRINIGFLLKHVTLKEQTSALLELMKDASPVHVPGISSDIHAHIF